MEVIQQARPSRIGPRHDHHAAPRQSEATSSRAEGLRRSVALPAAFRSVAFQAACPGSCNNIVEKRLALSMETAGPVRPHGGNSTLDSFPDSPNSQSDNQPRHQQGRGSRLRHGGHGGCRRALSGRLGQQRLREPRGGGVGADNQPVPALDRAGRVQDQFPVEDRRKSSIGIIAAEGQRVARLT